MRIRNNKNTYDVWVGQGIDSQQYYDIQPNETHLWQTNDKVLQDLSNGNLSIGDGVTYKTTITEAINYLLGRDIEVVDNDGATIIRPKAAKAGWTYFLCPIEFTTSTLNSVVAKKFDNSNRAGITYKIYDSNNQEITDANNEVDAVKTVIDFEPTHDYEIIGGQIQQHTTPNTNIRIWVVGVPDISEQYGGSKEMVGGVNLKFIDPTDKVAADGRVSKYMSYNATLHTNKLRLIITHNAGVRHDLLLMLEMFKA